MQNSRGAPIYMAFVCLDYCGNDFGAEDVRMESTDWRKTHSPVFRQYIINTIVNSIIHATGIPGPPVQKYVTKFEEEFYNLATSQLDYATRISEEISSFEINFSVHLDISDCGQAQNPSGLASSSMHLHQCQKLHGSHVQSQNVVQRYNMCQPQQLRDQFAKQVYQQPPQHQGNMQSSMLQIPLQQQQLTSQEQQPQENSILMQSRMQSASNSLQAPSNSEHQELHLIRAQTGLPEASLSELDAYNGSAAQTNQNAIDWLEEVYTKLQSLKDKYLMDIYGIYARANEACERFDAGERIISFRKSLGNILKFLKLSKSGIICIPDFEVKLANCEKQILRVIMVEEKPICSAQQPKKTAADAWVSIISHLKQLDNQTHSKRSMQSSPTTSLATALGAHQSQQCMLSASQPAQNMSLAHEHAFVSSPQNVMHSLQRSIVSGVQQVGMSKLPQGGSLLQPNTLKSSATIIREHNLKQQREQNWKRELMIENQKRKQQVIEQEQLRQQQFHQPGQPMPNVPQINESNRVANEMTIQPGLPKSGIFHLHHHQSQSMQHMPQSGQMNTSYPQFLHSESSQKSQESTPQSIQQNLDVGTNTASSPSTLPSPEVACVSTTIAKFPSVSHSPTTVLSPINTELYSPTSKMPCVSNSGNVGSQQATQENTPLPLKPLSPEKLRSVNGNESISIGGEDLAVMTDQERQSRESPDDSSPSAKKMKRNVDATPVNTLSPVDGNNDNFRLSSSFEAPELESTATSKLLERNEAEAKQSLIEELEDINLRLIDTVVEISDENVDSVAEAPTTEGTIVKCTYNAAVCNQSESQLKVFEEPFSKQTSMTLRLLVPTSYPSCSPVPLDELPAETSDQIQDFSGKAKALFDIALRGLTQPTLAEIVSTWSACARQAAIDFA